MNWYDSSMACLDVAKQFINEIDTLSHESIKNKNLENRIMILSKNCLENCRSPLDYAAYYVFMSYCSRYYDQSKIVNKKIYFPIRADENEFNEYMERNFKNLKTNRHDIFDIFKNCQLFSGEGWLNNLSLIINANKHITIQDMPRNQFFKINKGHIGGAIFTNSTIELPPSGIPLMVNGSVIDITSPSPYHNLVDAEIKHKYYFSNLDSPVILVLTDICNGTYKLISELKHAIDS